MLRQWVHFTRVIKRPQFVLVLVVLAVVLVVSTAPAIRDMSSSTPVLPQPSYNGRCDKTAVSQIAMDKCVAGEIAQLTSEMHIALNDETSEFSRTLVTSAQDAWVSFEKAECQLEDSSYKGGTIQPLIYGVCERGLLVQRINEIDAVLRAAPH